MVNLTELREFLVDAKKSTWASGNSTLEKKEDDKSTTLSYTKGNWKYHDNFFGGEPFGGREVVFFHNKPVYIMVYYGRVFNTHLKPGDIYQVLKAALLNMPSDKPFRGPAHLVVDQFTYANTPIGDLVNFSGTEMITLANQTVYEARYLGGLVDQQKD